LEPSLKQRVKDLQKRPKRMAAYLGGSEVHDRVQREVDRLPPALLSPSAEDHRRRRASGTTLKVAVERGRHGLGIELNPEYVELAERQLAGVTPPMFTEAVA
jgi:hypothetical protein